MFIKALADWKSDHLVQFLNMRLEATEASEEASRTSVKSFFSCREAAEDQDKTGAIGGAWSAEIQPPGRLQHPSGEKSWRDEV